VNNLLNELTNDVTKLDKFLAESQTVREQQLLKQVDTYRKKNVFKTTKRNPEVIALASRISNMEILFSESGQTFPLGMMRGQPDFGVHEVTWVNNILKKQMSDPLLRKAVNHLITGSEVTKDREVFVDIMGASIFVVDHVFSLVKLIGYAHAFGCKSIYELSDLFNFHIIKQDYSQPAIVWFFNNTQSVQKGWTDV